MTEVVMKLGKSHASHKCYVAHHCVQYSLSLNSKCAGKCKCILVRHSRFSCRYIACTQLHFVLFNLENSKILNRIIQIQELTFCIYDSLGKLGHTLKQNSMEIDISYWKPDYKEYRGTEIETDTEKETVFFLVETLSLF